MRMKLRMSVLVLTFDTSYRPEEKLNKLLSKPVPAQYLYKMDETALLHEH